MSRHLKKSYTDLQGDPERSSTLTFSLADVDLTEEQIDSIRQEAVKAAIRAATPFIEKASTDSPAIATPPSPRDPNTFSTFSTFSTFGSATGPGEVDEPMRD